jgi:transposase
MLSGAFDAEAINIYFERILLPELPRGSVVVLDNASFHHASKAEELARSRSVELLYLPKHSPDMNFTAHFWARLKRHLRPLLPTSFNIDDTISAACVLFSAKMS